MDTRHLQTFVIAAETQSFTRTAEMIGLTQAAVSQQIASLETELGKNLFDRGARSVSLTDFGRHVHQQARNILDIVENIKLEAGQIPTELEGVVTIASSTVPSEWLLPEILLVIRAAYPNVRESVRVSDSETAIAAVEAGEVDFALVGELPRATNLCAKRVADDELVLVVPPTHSFAKLKIIEPIELMNQPLIFRESGSGSRRCIENALSSARLAISELTIPIEVNSNEAIRAAVERGVGISFLSRRTIEREMKEGRLITVEIKDVNIVRCLYLVTDPQRVPNRVMNAVLKLVDEFRKKTMRAG